MISSAVILATLFDQSFQLSQKTGRLRVFKFLFGMCIIDTFRAYFRHLSRALLTRNAFFEFMLALSLSKCITGSRFFLILLQPSFLIQYVTKS